jgi:uncharacterized protein YoxC
MSNDLMKDIEINNAKVDKIMLLIKDIQESYNNFNENSAENAQLCQKFVSILEKVEDMTNDLRETYADIMCEFYNEVGRQNSEIADTYINNIVK